MATTFATPKDKMIVEREEEIKPKTRVFLVAVREALLLILTAIEDYLGMPRTKERQKWHSS